MRYGPAREAPRLQRWILSLPLWAQGVFVGVATSAGLLAVMWIARGEILLPVAVILLLSPLVGAVVFGRLPDRELTEDQRMSKVVAYFPASPISGLRGLRRRYVVLIGLASIYSFARLLLSDPGPRDVVGIALSLGVLVLCVLALRESAGGHRAR